MGEGGKHSLQPNESGVAQHLINAACRAVG